MRFSIFIPVYNGEHYLRATLDSILAQTFTDWELLCLDDTSTDNSYALLLEYSSHDNRIRSFQKPNGGCVPLAWEYIIPHLKGDFTLYMSQDDLLKPETLAKLSTTQESSDADAVCPTVYYYREGEPLEREGESIWDNQTLTGLDFFRLMVSHRVPGHILTRTSIIKQIGIRTDAYNADDIATPEWMAHCKCVSFSDAVFLYRQDNPQAITKTFRAIHYTDLISNCNLLELTQRFIPSDTTLHQKMRNFYFECLYKRMVNYHQHKSSYSSAEQHKIYSIFHSTWKKLHKGVTASERKYLYGKLSWPLWCAIIRAKATRLTRQNIILCFDFVDKIPY